MGFSAVKAICSMLASTAVLALGYGGYCILGFERDFFTTPLVLAPFIGISLSLYLNSIDDDGLDDSQSYSAKFARQRNLRFIFLSSLSLILIWGLSNDLIEWRIPANYQQVCSSDYSSCGPSDINSIVRDSSKKLLGHLVGVIFILLPILLRLTKVKKWLQLND